MRDITCASLASARSANVSCRRRLRFLIRGGMGKWILKQMQEFFETDSEKDDLTKKGNKNKGAKRYMPQKNSVAYALLVTLSRGTENGNEFMCKKELINVAETSGLPEKAKGKLETLEAHQWTGTVDGAA
ncbi:Crossover junction endonuclease mus81 [Orobanche minor]